MKRNLSILMLLFGLTLLMSCEKDPIDVTNTNEEEFEGEVISCDLSIEFFLNDSIPSVEGYALTTFVTGGTEPYSYLWSTGSTEDAIQIDSTAEYTLDVTDAEGCTLTQTFVNVESSCDLEVELTFDPSVGAIHARVTGGTEPYSYQWSTGLTDASIPVIGIEEYIVEVTDAEGCTIIQSINISESNCDNFSVNIVEDTIGFQIFTQVNGGTPPYAYTWDNNESTESNIPIGNDSLFVVYVTDSQGCLTTDTIFINSPVDCSDFSVELFYEEFSAMFRASIMGGTAPFSYLWSTGETTEVIFGQDMGTTYSVIITDANGCGYFAEYTIPDTSGCNNLDVFIFQDSLFNDLIAITSGGNPPYTYIWSTNETSEMINVTESAEYTVTVIDNIGCTNIYSQFFELVDCGNNGTIGFSYDQVAGTLLGSPNGGVGPFLYNWSTGETTQVINVTPGNTYTLQIEDINGCVFVSDFNT